MNPSTSFFPQNWQASASDVANGYINNWRVFSASKRIRLLHVSVQHTGANHIKLYVYSSGSTAQYNLVDDFFGVNQDAIWNGSMVLSDIDSIGAQILNPALNDNSWLRIIWEELDP